MSFLAPNEFIIGISAGAYWEPPPTYYLALENRVGLRNAGIQTLIEFLDWSSIEPVQGDYDFSDADEMVRINREAGLKTIFVAPSEKSPRWMPDEWMLKNAEGGTEMRDNVPDYRISSFWNEEAQSYVLEHLKLLVKRYHAPDVMFMLGELQGGECLLSCEPFYYDEFAMADYKKRSDSLARPERLTNVINLNRFVPETKDWLQESVIENLVRKYKILNQHKMVWNQQQLLMNDWSQSTVNYAQKDVLRAYVKAFPNSDIGLMQYTYWDNSHHERHRDHVDEIQKEFQCDVFVEAEWPQGLSHTAPNTIEKGYRGQVVGVNYQGASATSLSSETLDAIKWAHDLWIAKRGVK